jgi:hypothetical protein
MSEELVLIDRLSGMTMAQLRGAIGSENQQGDAALSCFNDCRKKVCARRSRGTDYCNRHLTPLCQSQSKETCRSLV